MNLNVGSFQFSEVECNRRCSEEWIPGSAGRIAVVETNALWHEIVRSLAAGIELNDPSETYWLGEFELCTGVCYQKVLWQRFATFFPLWQIHPCYKLRWQMQ